MKPTLNASGRLEDGGHDRGKMAFKLLDATTAFSLIVYGGTEVREPSSNLCSCQQSLYSLPVDARKSIYFHSRR